MDNKSFDQYLGEVGEVGFVESVVQTIALISGLPGAHLGEEILFESGQLGQVTSLRSNVVEVLVLSRDLVKVGTRATRTDKKLSIPVGQSVMGRVVDVLGRSLLGDSIMGGDVEWMQLDVQPSGITARKRVNLPLETGVALIDLMIPIGRGQRELVIGDRKTGKSRLLWQVIMSQARLGTICIYAAVGKKRTEIMQVQEFFEKQGLVGNTVIVAASSHDSEGEIFLCPYTAMAVAEYFRNKGKEVLLVMDDMTTHAKFYRELSLLSRKFPGRDSYPGDIFHVHSKLLERAGNFLVAGKEVAITCLPVVETVQGDITGYIQTNMMSMTDGHIYFDSELFFKGRRPAINPFISVTRVGHQTQSKLFRDAGRVLFDLLNNYERTQAFLRFGSELGETSRQILTMGDRVLGFFDQPVLTVVNTNVAVVSLGLLISGLWDGKGLARFVKAYETDPAIKSMVDGMVSVSESMNKLTEECRKNKDVIGRVFV